MLHEAAQPIPGSGVGVYHKPPRYVPAHRGYRWAACWQCTRARGSQFRSRGFSTGRLSRLLGSLTLALGCGWLALLVPGTTANAQTYEELPAELAQQARSLHDRVMCPQCAGQTIGQSQAPIAAAMREIIRDRLLEGQTAQEILDFLVDSFGEEVLASPPKRGISLLVWLVPPAALLLGAAAVALAIRGLRRKPGEERRTPSERTLARYLKLVDQEMLGEEPPGSR